MEYYKELFFTKQKHNYNLEYINFYNDDMDVIKYNNIPSKGFKICRGNYLDPKTGYIFQPQNGLQFKEKLLRLNLIKNGICVAPVIFEYKMGGMFNIHLYDDVKEQLNDVGVLNKVSLSESVLGELLRNIDDESYYIYFGPVAQYYVSESGVGTIKKKHLILKTNWVTDNDISISKFTFIDYTKDTIKSYFKVRDIPLTELRINYYTSTSKYIDLINYIHNGVFDVNLFQSEYPSLMLSNTIRRVFNTEYIMKTKNRVKLEYSYIGYGSLTFKYDISYDGYDQKQKKFYNAKLIRSIYSKEFPEIDFNKYNYVVELNGVKFLLAPRRLKEFDADAYDLKLSVNILTQYGLEDILFYRLNNATISYSKKFDLEFIKSFSNYDWSQKVKIFKINYCLNDVFRSNIFDNPFVIDTPYDKYISDSSVFDSLKLNKMLSINLIGFTEDEEL